MVRAHPERFFPAWQAQFLHKNTISGVFSDVTQIFLGSLKYRAAAM
jgi:hypothetical protein